MRKLQLGMQILAVILFTLPATALILLLSSATDIIFVVISLVMTWLLFSEGKSTVFFLIAIPGACLVLAGLLFFYTQFIADPSGIFGTAFETVFAVILLCYGVTIGLGSVLALLARSTHR